MYGLQLNTLLTLARHKELCSCNTFLFVSQSLPIVVMNFFYLVLLHFFVCDIYILAADPEIFSRRGSNGNLYLILHKHKGSLRFSKAKTMGKIPW